MQYNKEDILKLGDDKECVVVDNRLVNDVEYYLLVNIEDKKDFFFVSYVFKDGKDYVKKIEDKWNIFNLVEIFKRKD